MHLCEIFTNCTFSIRFISIPVIAFLIALLLLVITLLRITLCIIRIISYFQNLKPILHLILNAYRIQFHALSRIIRPVYHLLKNIKLLTVFLIRIENIYTLRRSLCPKHTEFSISDVKRWKNLFISPSMKTLKQSPSPAQKEMQSTSMKTSYF